MERGSAHVIGALPLANPRYSVTCILHPFSNAHQGTLTVTAVAFTLLPSFVSSTVSPLSSRIKTRYAPAANPLGMVQVVAVVPVVWLLTPTPRPLKLRLHSNLSVLW